MSNVFIGLGPNTDLYEARQICRFKGYFIVVKPTEFLLFRKAEPKSVFVGKRSTATAMLALVRKVVDTPVLNN